MANTYLARTYGTPTSTQKWTASFWIKRGDLGREQHIFGGQASCQCYFNSSDIFRFYDQTAGTAYNTTQVFRDTSAWYHFVIAVDTTLGIAGDRARIYVNGSEITSFSIETNATQNNNSGYNVSGTSYAIGRYNPSQASDYYFNGSMSHIHFIDGTAYDASAFGSTDSVTGEWKINTSPSVTYGTNGFFILKDGNSVTDQSGEGNDFTVGGGTLTKTEDSPSNVFATWNSLFRRGTITPTFSNGNLTSNFTGGAQQFALTSLGASSGKYYAELKWVSSHGNAACITGILDMAFSGTADPNDAVTNAFGYFASGNKHISGSSSSYGASYTSGDIIGIAIDCDNSKLYFSKNGVYQNSGVPTSGSTGTGAIPIISGVTYGIYGSEYDGRIANLNTGNGYFGTTAVSSAGTNASGNGIFEYDVPTGYTALSTKGLNL